MELTTLVTLAVLVLAISTLYASVGHGGASGYLAAMALLSVNAAAMRPTALALNIIVASIGLYKYWRAGWFSWTVLWPFVVTSIPAAFVGGAVELPVHVYMPVVGAALLYAAFRLYTSSRGALPDVTRSMPRSASLVTGAGIGLLSGLTGVGGGIFLSPILLLGGWCDTRTTSGVAAAFILVNSVAGLAGYVSQGAGLPDFLPVLAVTVVVGGVIGAELGSRRLPLPMVRRLLALVLLIAGLKMVFSAFG
ncbi:MAG: sulfite exporter TauE/SafE family protein [Rhodothermales bacterium]|nr:sulfite exporter TauE/SafE family protein [Rhodothermales bacterium]